MANLHMEGLDDDDVLECAEQALASLNLRFNEDEERIAELGDAGPLIADEIRFACDHFDRFAALVRGEETT